MKNLRHLDSSQGLGTALRGYTAALPLGADWLSWTHRVFKYASVAVAIGYILAYMVMALIRMQYPFELEMMEGGVVDHVRRILAGEKLYVEPSLEFVPYIYPPLYFYVSALISEALGIGFEPLRLVSFLASLGAFLFVFLIVHRETGSKLAGLLGAGLLAATFEISGAWFDIARVDSLFIALLLAGIYLVRFHASPRAFVIAGLVVALSYFTKQAAFFVMFPLILYLVLVSWQRAIYFVGALGIVAGGGTLLRNYIHDGWYQFYVFDLPQQHPIAPEFIPGFWTGDLLAHVPVTMALAAFYLKTRLTRSGKSCLLFYGMITGGMILGAWFSRLHTGGWANVLIPAYAAISIPFGLAIHELRQAFKRHAMDRRLVAGALVSLLATIQLGMLFYNPTSYIPTADDAEAGERLIAAIAGIDGEVLMTDHGFLPALAGKETYAHTVAVHDVLRGGDEQIKAQLINEIRQAIREQRFDALVLESGFVHRGVLYGSHWLTEDINDSYQRHRLTIFDDPSVFRPVTGWPTRPEAIYVPRVRAAGR